MTTSGANKMNYITKRPSHVLRLDAEIAKKASKYGNRKTYCTARHLHDSGKESRRCEELMLLEKGGEIEKLVQQPIFPLHGISGAKVCIYRADFAFVDARTNVTVVEDCKGMKTPIYRLKAKMMKAEYGIVISET